MLVNNMYQLQMNHRRRKTANSVLLACWGYSSWTALLIHMSLKFHILLDGKFRQLEVAFYLFIVYRFTQILQARKFITIICHLSLFILRDLFVLNLLIKLNLCTDIDVAKISWVLSWFHIRQWSKTFKKQIASSKYITKNAWMYIPSSILRRGCLPDCSRIC